MPVSYCAKVATGGNRRIENEKAISSHNEKTQIVSNSSFKETSDFRSATSNHTNGFSDEKIETNGYRKEKIETNGHLDETSTSNGYRDDLENASCVSVEETVVIRAPPSKSVKNDAWSDAKTSSLKSFEKNIKSSISQSQETKSSLLSTQKSNSFNQTSNCNYSSNSLYQNSNCNELKSDFSSQPKTFGQKLSEARSSSQKIFEKHSVNDVTKSSFQSNSVKNGHSSSQHSSFVDEATRWDLSWMNSIINK